MSASTPKADILRVVEKRLLVTLSGHSPERLTFPHEQEVTTVMASLADVGVLWGLLGGYHQRAWRLRPQRRSFSGLTPYCGTAVIFVPSEE